MDSNDQLQPLHGLLFFRGEVRTCVACEVSQTSARLHSDGLGLLPIDFYVTFDDFLTVWQIPIAWQWQDDVDVIFEGWVNDPFDQLQGRSADASRDFHNVIETLKAQCVLRDGNSVEH